MLGGLLTGGGTFPDRDGRRPDTDGRRPDTDARRSDPDTRRSDTDVRRPNARPLGLEGGLPDDGLRTGAPSAPADDGLD